MKRVVVHSKEELNPLIQKNIEVFGNECNLNFIDTGLITDMTELFYNSSFNGDISDWDVSNVTNMKYMFFNSSFNGDISDWNVSNVTDMKSMFEDSKFNQDISNWNVSNVTNMYSMFYNSDFNQDISNWKSKLNKHVNMDYMFDYSHVNHKPFPYL